MSSITTAVAADYRLQQWVQLVNRELLIDRREKSKSLTWSSVVLAFENSKGISEEVKKPKALGDIRGVSYIYPILWRFGLIRVPEAIEKKMGKQR